MRQSRLMSLVEALANVIFGYGTAVATQFLVFPLFGIHAELVGNLMIGGIFTLVSLARGYALRRVFEALRATGGRARPVPNTGPRIADYANPTPLAPAACSSLKHISGDTGVIM